MSKIPLQFGKGRVIHVTAVPDENGGNVKDRPAIVIEQEGDDLYVAFTTTDLSPQENKVPVRSGPGANNGLDQKSMVVGRWYRIVPRDRVCRVGLLVGHHELRDIVGAVGRELAKLGVAVAPGSALPPPEL